MSKDDDLGVRGKKDLEKKVDPDAPNKDLDKYTPETRAEAAVALKIGGASYTSIAKTLGYSTAYRARQAVEQALAATAESPEERDQMRVLTSRRINRLLQSVMGRATNPRDPDHLAYNQQALRLIDREAKLWGVDAPQQVSLTTPSDDTIASFVQRALELGAVASRQAEEADILDAEVLEDAEDEGFNPHA